MKHYDKNKHFSTNNDATCARMNILCNCIIYILVLIYIIHYTRKLLFCPNFMIVPYLIHV